MKKQTVGERYGMQQIPPSVIISSISQDGQGMQQIQTIYTQIKQALAQASQATNQIQAQNPELAQIHYVKKQLAIAVSQLQLLQDSYHKSVLGLNASIKEQLNKLGNELTQAGQTLQFLESSLPL